MINLDIVSVIAFREIAESSAAPILKKMKANLSSLPFNLISGFSDLIDSLAKRVPVIMMITIRDSKKISTRPPYLLSVGVSKMPISIGLVNRRYRNIALKAAP